MFELAHSTNSVVKSVLCRRIRAELYSEFNVYIFASQSTLWTEIVRHFPVSWLFTQFVNISLGPILRI